MIKVFCHAASPFDDVHWALLCLDTLPMLTHAHRPRAPPPRCSGLGSRPRIVWADECGVAARRVPVEVEVRARLRLGRARAPVGDAGSATVRIVCGRGARGCGVWSLGPTGGGAARHAALVERVSVPKRGRLSPGPPAAAAHLGRTPHRSGLRCRRLSSAKSPLQRHTIAAPTAVGLPRVCRPAIFGHWRVLCCPGRNVFLLRSPLTVARCRCWACTWATGPAPWGTGWRP